MTVTARIKMKICDYGNGKLVNIKFEDGTISNLLYNGIKTSTTRLEKKGEVGDWFSFKGNGYSINKITETTVLIACADYYYKEGYNSSQDMLNDLIRLYPNLIINDPSDGKGMGIKSSVVYVHEFYQVTYACYDALMKGELK